LKPIEIETLRQGPFPFLRTAKKEPAFRLMHDHCPAKHRLHRPPLNMTTAKENARREAPGIGKWSGD
ncbi:hypothetical protein, partial [Mesorhizobium sp. M7A.F.Ca.AU.002.02.1.1]|uniref:hypothetical protein n=1 Tax=Mesorhizobium sp. M7A.F.Ca.AU.002.02.1.1 TaxID=2496671 RepID=UPI0019D2EAE8